MKLWQLTVKWKCPWPMRCWVEETVVLKQGLGAWGLFLLVQGQESRWNPHGSQPLPSLTLALNLLRSSLMFSSKRETFYYVFTLLVENSRGGSWSMGIEVFHMEYLLWYRIPSQTRAWQVKDFLSQIRVWDTQEGWGVGHNARNVDTAGCR